jgi:hypothetical protein
VHAAASATPTASTDLPLIYTPPVARNNSAPPPPGPMDVDEDEVVIVTTPSTDPSAQNPVCWFALLAIYLPLTDIGCYSTLRWVFGCPGKRPLLPQRLLLLQLQLSCTILHPHAANGANSKPLLLMWSARTLRP